MGWNDKRGLILPGEEHHSRDKDTEVLSEDKSEPEGSTEEVLWRREGVFLESEKGDEEKMNEELKYHKALQPFYGKAMGLWRVGDRLKVYYRGIDCDGVVLKVYEDMIHTYTEAFGKVNFCIDDLAILRIPHTIDSVNPERGLWGMVSFEKYHPDINGYGGILFIRRTDGEPVSDTWDAPTLALLKA